MDRKSWIIIFLCSLIMGLHIFYSGKNKQVLAQQQAVQNAQTAGAAPQGTPSAMNEPLIEASKEEKHDFELEKLKLHFSSKQGGIVTAEFMEQFAVGSKTERVKANLHGQQAVGALTNGADVFIENGMAVENVVAGKEISYLGKTSNGLIVRKKYTMSDPASKVPGDDYRVRLEMTLQNPSSNSINLGDLGIFVGAATPLYAREYEEPTGFFYCDNRNLEFKNGSGLKSRAIKNAGGTWFAGSERVAYAGVANQYFTTVIKPAEKINASTWARSSQVDIAGINGAPESKASVRGSLGLPKEVLAAGQSKTLQFDVYYLPKKNPLLRSMNNDFGEIMNYGWFSLFARSLNRILTTLHDFVFVKMTKDWAWGWAVVALTIFLRAIMWPLQAKSTREMKRMSKLSPLMKDIREKYPEDPAKQNMETMKLYRDYGINPTGGCLPMFVQMPIFFGFFRMLQYAVEFRGQKFLWVDDLSQPDTLYTMNLPFHVPLLGDHLNLNILPFLMVGTMILQMRMTPMTGDKTQQMVFKLMPIMFFLFCYNNPSALALYWTVGNIFQILQTYIMKRKPEPELVKVDRTGKKGFMERMQEMQATAQKQQQARGGISGAARGPVIDVTEKKKRGPKTGG